MRIIPTLSYCYWSSISLSLSRRKTAFLVAPSAGDPGRVRAVVDPRLRRGWQPRARRLLVQGRRAPLRDAEPPVQRAQEQRLAAHQLHAAGGQRHVPVPRLQRGGRRHRLHLAQSQK